jgi:hypothetical protein
VNETTKRFPRVASDSPMASIGSISGPYTRGFRMHKLLTGFTLLCAILGTLVLITGALK